MNELNELNGLMELQPGNYTAVYDFYAGKSSTFPPYPSCWRTIPGGYLLIIRKHQHWLWYGLRGDGCMLPEISVLRSTG